MSKHASSSSYSLSALAVVSALLAGCSVTPAYKVPETAAPSAYKETPSDADKAAAGWTAAAPADTLERGPWWQLFGDPLLNQMADSIEVNNQNVAAAIAAYAQARSLVAEQRASLFPSVNLNGSATRTGGGGNTSTANQYRANIGASWEPDVWGKLRANVSNADASLQASAADLAAARLSAQGELATNYFSLRQTDAEKALLDATVEGYERVLQITQNRFDAGITAKSDLLQAQTQLASARIDQITLVRQRATLEHAIAVLLGKPAGDYTLAPADWKIAVPDIPTGVPSTLLQRRPDIAAAERRVAAANANIGIARSAYFPSLNLTGSYGYGSSSTGGLFNASNNLWSLGLTAAQTLFDAGAIKARVSGAEAARDQAIANYRQTVLTAFADVENQLAATRTLAQQQDLRKVASEAADQVEVQMLNRYRAGQVSYSDVVTAQQTALSARRSLVQAQADRQTTAIALIQSLGGGWHAAQ
ncbi:MULTISPECIES: efflux transporter outer membrane subunit [unclassified Duganella]|uniref:efflux transporter outer membrane subunit n=1 Tax=unclassified Duganella TaxID=2636909 RepID=UPI0008880691|nr:MULTISPECIES: efflux transporter outer membrane subunit [unclassified Duganella]SDF50580.1 efflux transporter, outer membrane factor (OMF) lipoprotein, NodT family [Duganella sp. OV458]SDI76463.1 efflux transporter, outer membrane factor (OMF) lipoprotein, NodT family [Duganella sp. OV510]